MAPQRFIKTIAIIGVGLLLYVCATAGVAQLQLICGATDGCANRSRPGFLFEVSLTSFFAVPLVVASGYISASVLHRYHVRTWLAYLTNAIVSAILGAYAFIFNFGVADNLGAILLHVPKNGRDMTDGMIEQAPPFVQTLGDLLREFPGIVGGEWTYFSGAVLFALIVSLICGGLFWVLVVRRTVVKRGA